MKPKEAFEILRDTPIDIRSAREDDIHSLYATAQNMALDALERQMWIPCSERLPKCNGCYLVWRPHFFGGEASMPAICYFDGQDTWHDSYGVDFTRILNKKDVIAWMPLPEPYKEGE